MHLVFLQSIAFDQFVVNAGADASGVATEMVTLNATVKFNFRNWGTFFGVHVSSTPLVLAYTELTLATGTVSGTIFTLNCHNLIQFQIYLNLHEYFTYLRFACADQEILSIKKGSKNRECKRARCSCSIIRWRCELE